MTTVRARDGLESERKVFPGAELHDQRLELQLCHTNPSRWCVIVRACLTIRRADARWCAADVVTSRHGDRDEEGIQCVDGREQRGVAYAAHRRRSRRQSLCGESGAV